MTEPIDRLNAALQDRYAIERELGEGGMATVYLVDDLKHARKVALKVLKPELAAVVGARAVPVRDRNESYDQAVRFATASPSFLSIWTI
jgi:serine/threonine protein kinase